MDPELPIRSLDDTIIFARQKRGTQPWADPGRPEGCVSCARVAENVGMPGGFEPAIGRSGSIASSPRSWPGRPSRGAGHASFAGLDGWESHLGLAEDSLLTIGDILTLPATPAYVVLSGCETAATAAVRDASGLGLAQAFVIAGARWVVASTRPVKDLDASAIVAALHAEQALGSGAEIAVLLQAAQKKLIETAPAIDWASFRVIVP